MIVLLPAVVEVRSQFPNGALPVQTADPSVTLTVPPGLPDAGLVATTPKVTVYVAPATEGSGASLVMLTAVAP